MQIHRRLNYRLKPTDAQEQLFGQFAGVCRLVYNLALEQRQKWGKSHGCNYNTAYADLKELRREFDFVRAVSQTAQNQALRDLETAFQKFFRKEASYPSPRKRGVHDSFRFAGREIKIQRIAKNWAHVFLPKIGMVKMRLTRPVEGKICDATIKRIADGWEVSICVERQVEEQQPLKGDVAGDMGVSVPLTLSDGTTFHLPEELDRAERAKRRAQKQASRKKRGSKRHAKAMQRVRKLAAKAARIRKQWQHETSTFLARTYGRLVLEDMKTKNMTASAKGSMEEPGRNVRQKAGLNRVILAVGWYALRQMCIYKFNERSGEIVLVDPRHTSQTCSACGHVDRESRKSQASFLCTSCGHEMNADHNAALNIHRRGNTPSARIVTMTGTDVDSGRRRKAPGLEASTLPKAA